MSQNRASAQHWSLSPYGAFGAVLPSIVSLIQKSEVLTVSLRPEVIGAMVIYILSAAVLAGIFPYGRRPTPFNATIVGILFPTIVGSAAGIAKHTLPLSNLGSTRSDDESSSALGDWLDAFSLF
jgi:hypothetical protein